MGSGGVRGLGRALLLCPPSPSPFPFATQRAAHCRFQASQPSISHPSPRNGRMATVTVAVALALLAVALAQAL